jgi:hypothetical protein
MALKTDKAQATGTDAAEAVTISLEEYNRLKAAGEVNTEPAIEEGPHLKDKEVRAAKRQQLIDAGYTADDERLTPDMAAILKEKGH